MGRNKDAETVVTNDLRDTAHPNYWHRCMARFEHDVPQRFRMRCQDEDIERADDPGGLRHMPHQVYRALEATLFDSSLDPGGHPLCLSRGYWVYFSTGVHYSQRKIQFLLISNFGAKKNLKIKVLGTGNATKRAVIDDQTGVEMRPSGRAIATKRAAGGGAGRPACSLELPYP